MFWFKRGREDARDLARRPSCPAEKRMQQFAAHRYRRSMIGFVLSIGMLVVVILAFFFE